MKFDTHLCLVSAQATPNLAPALDPNFQPRRIVLAVSPEMQDRANWLEAVLKERGASVEILEISNPYDYNQCWDCFTDWIAVQPGDVALNVTGGTKVMAMAAQDVFREESKPVFYVNVENDQVIRIDSRGTPFILPTQIRLPQYLKAHGYAVLKKPIKPDITKDTRDFVNRLAYDSERLGKALGILNWLSQQAKTTTLTSPTLDGRNIRNEPLDELIGRFKHEGKLDLVDNKLVFPDEDARQFVNGGWLEYLIYQSLAQLAPELGIGDYAIGMEVLAPDGKTRNELDAACLKRNTLHIIECKSANLSLAGKTGEASGTDALYKLDALRRMGGSRTKAMLVDFRGSLDDVDKRRAAQMNLRVVAGSQLRDLPGALKEWLK